MVAILSMASLQDIKLNNITESHPSLSSSSISSDPSTSSSAAGERVVVRKPSQDLHLIDIGDFSTQINILLSHLRIRWNLPKTRVRVKYHQGIHFCQLYSIIQIVEFV